MLVKFSCNAYGDIMMFSDIATRLLRMMGQSGQIPGAIYQEDIGSAMKNLKQAIAVEKKAAAGVDQGTNDSDDKEEPPIAIEVRAFPLIEMLKAADRENCNVMWEKM